ncbi:hypothetical protein D3C79_710430 [compost metagenome]
MADQWQTPDVLMEVLADRVGQRVAQQAAEKTQQQGLAEAERTAAGQHRDGEQQHGARYDDAGNGQAFDAGDQENGQAKPLWVGAEPASKTVEPLAHEVSFLVPE